MTVESIWILSLNILLKWSSLITSSLLYLAKLYFLNLLTEKATSLREPKKFVSVDSSDIAAPESHIDEKIQMSPFAEAKRIVLLCYLLLFWPSCPPLLSPKQSFTFTMQNHSYAILSNSLVS